MTLEEYIQELDDATDDGETSQEFHDEVLPILTRFASEIEQAKVRECAKKADRVCRCPTEHYGEENPNHERYCPQGIRAAILSLNKQEQPESGKEKA